MEKDNLIGINEFLTDAGPRLFFETASMAAISSRRASKEPVSTIPVKTARLCLPVYWVKSMDGTEGVNARQPVLQKARPVAELMPIEASFNVKREKSPIASRWSLPRTSKIPWSLVAPPDANNSIRAAAPMAQRAASPRLGRARPWKRDL